VSADLGYVRGSNIIGRGHHGDALTLLVGPVFYLTRHKRLTTYARVFVGGTRVTGAFPSAPGGFATGYVNKASCGFGAGVEYRVTGSFAFRAGTDYLHTSFFGSSRVIRGQNNIRAVVSVAYYFGLRRRR
jgi:opacity protein-like surface antigen